MTDTLPSEVNFARWVRRSNAGVTEDVITWNGILTQGESLTWQWVVTHAGDHNDTVVNTAEFEDRGSGERGEASAIFNVIAPLHVTATDPPANAVGVIPSTNIAATFDGDIDAETAGANTFVGQGMLGGRLEGTYDYDGSRRTVTLNPSRDLFPGEIVRTTVTSGTMSIEAVETEPYQWEFTAGPELGRCTGGFVEDVAVSSTLTDVAYSSVAWGDYDGDGHLDILLTGNTDGGNRIAQIWHNEGDGTFSEAITDTLVEVSNGAVAWGDYDNDSDLDLLLTGHSDASPVTQLLQNDGNEFSEVTGTALHGVPGLGRSAVAWGDYDNSGSLDLLLTGYTGSGRVTQLWRNEGGIFTNETTSVLPDVTGVYSSSVAWGDYNNDGAPDFLLIGYTGVYSLTHLWRNDRGIFTEVAESALPGVPGMYAGTAVWADYDRDLDLDLLLSGRTGSGPVTQLWRNGGSGTFTEVAASVLPGVTDVYSSTAAWGDYDNDGNPDLLLTGHAGDNPVTQLWHNNGNGTFTDVTVDILADAPDIYYGAVAWGDYDNDHDLDLLLTSQTGSRLVTKLFRNEDCTFELSIGKWVTPETDVDYHDTVTYTVVLSNGGTSIAENVYISDVLPAEVTFARWVRQSGASENNDDITWSGTVTPGQPITWTWVVTHTGSYGDVVSNTAKYGHPFGANGSATAQFRVEGPPVLGIRKTAKPESGVNYHGLVTYTVTVSNSGTSPAAGVYLTDVLPAEVTFGWWIQQNGASESGDEITWSGAVTSGQTLTWTWTATHTGDYGDVVTNTATYGHPTAGTGSAEAAFTVRDAPVLTITKAVTPTTDVSYRGTVTYTVTLANGGSMAELGLWMTDTLPAETEMAWWIGYPPNSTSDGGGFYWNGAIGASQTLVWTWTMTLTGDPWQPVTNTVWYVQAGAGSGQASAALTPVDHAPDACDDTASTGPDAAVRVEALSNDVDPDGDALEVVNVTQGSNGSTISDGKVVTYTPDSGFDGDDLFVYTVSDPWGLTDTATVTVGVGELNLWLPVIVNEWK